MLNLYACKTSTIKFENDDYKSRIELKSKRHATTLFEGHIQERYAGEAIPSVEVLMYGSDGITRGAVTDAAGNFTIKDVPLGACQLRTNIDGYQDIKYDFNILEHAYHKITIKLKMIVPE
jgi:hypothetical protein